MRPVRGAFWIEKNDQRRSHGYRYEADQPLARLVMTALKIVQTLLEIGVLSHRGTWSLQLAIRFNLCRVHESPRSTPAVAQGIADRLWSIGDLLDGALATQPINPVVTAPDRRRTFRVIEGGKNLDDLLASGSRRFWND